MENKYRLHPLVAVAAVSVTLVSLAGVAAITGMLPSSHSEGRAQEGVPPTAMAALPSPAVTAQASEARGGANDDAVSAPAKAPAKPASHSKPAHQAARQSASTAPPAPTHGAPVAAPTPAQVAAICHSCGRVEAVRAIAHQAEPSGVGVAAGAVIGGLLGNQVGGGNGRKLATVAGVIGGTMAGNAIEKQARSTTTYEVRVRMEDGSLRSFPYASPPPFNAGDRIEVVNGQLSVRGG